jgi:hypothetical protein
LEWSTGHLIATKKEIVMTRDSETTDCLRCFIDQITSLTEKSELHWERQSGSAHRYARFNNNLLILGPATPMSGSDVPRYLFITPFDSPQCIEINSNDSDLGADVLKLVQDVEVITQDQPTTDPFAINDEFLNRLRV